MDSLVSSLILVAAGLLPSLIWLFFYLKKDSHPEPKHLLTTTFLMGIIVSPIAVALQALFSVLSIKFGISFFSQDTPQFYLWAALVEEVIKFLAVWLTALRSPEFDEPVDAMIYMITAGLGFAAIENILVMFNVIGQGTQFTLGVWVLRFSGATLLHALSSGLIGYFLAVSWFFKEHRKKLLIIGIAIATQFHTAFNVFLIMADGEIPKLVYTMGLLLIMAFLVSILFDKIKERHQSIAPDDAEAVLA